MTPEEQTARVRAFASWLIVSDQKSPVTATAYSGAVGRLFRTLGPNATSADVEAFARTYPSAQRGAFRSGWRRYLAWRESLGEEHAPLVTKRPLFLPTTPLDLLVHAAVVGHDVSPGRLAEALWFPCTRDARGWIFTSARDVVLPVRLAADFRATVWGPGRLTFGQPLVPRSMAQGAVPATPAQIEFAVARVTRMIADGKLEPWNPEAAPERVPHDPEVPAPAEPMIALT